MLTEDVLLSSVNNLAQRIQVFEKRDDDAFLNCLYEVAIVARTDYAHRGAQLPFSIERILEVGKQLLVDMRKPTSRSCYYLMLLYTASKSAEVQAAQIVRTWEMHGKIESLEGTYIHQKVELFILIRWLDQWRQVSPRMCLSKNCRGRHLQHRSIPLRQSCNALHGRRKQSFGITLWLRCVCQRELCGESSKFTTFRAWLSTKPLWTPLRAEWSLYSEDLNVCGQVDSLWFDLESNGVVVMADWKRARALLIPMKQNLSGSRVGREVTLVVRTSTILLGAMTLRSRHYMCLCCVRNLVFRFSA